MKRHRILLILAGALALSASLSFTASAQNEQSPIDIRPENSVITALPALQYTYSSSVNLHVINNGSPDVEATIRANLIGGGGSLLLSGVTYDLLQFHFHAPSEHLLNGHEFPMELHLVHQKQGSSGVNDLLVTGRWIVEGAFNSSLDPIFSSLPPNSSSPNDLTGFNLNALLPSDLRSYRYDGSLTAPPTPGGLPPFPEGVQWIMLNEPLEMSHAQILAFEALFPAGNTREPQNLDGRFIITDVPEPSTLAFLGMGVGLLMMRSRRK